MTTPTRPSASRVASTLFNTGPNDQLAAVDVYTDKPTGVINTLVDKLSSFDTSIFDRGGSSGITGQLSALFSGKRGSFSVNSSDMLGRVNALVGGSRGGLSSLTGSVLASLSRGNGLNYESASRLAVTVGGVESRVHSSDPTSVANFMGVVNTLAGDPSLGSVLDEGAETSLLTGIVQHCISMGVPGAISGVAGNARSPTALRTALGNNVGTALDAGSLTALNAILDQPGGRGIIMSRAPNATSRLMNSYSLPAGTRPSDYPTRASELTSTLGRMDPNWSTYSRGGSSINNLTVFTRASPDALKVLSTDPTHRVSATIARDFTSVTSMKGTAKRLYPNMQFIRAA